MTQYRSKKPNEIISVESIELLRHYGYIIVDKGAIGRAQREAVRQWEEDNGNLPSYKDQARTMYAA